MLRRTTPWRIKPYLHSFSPGARSSEKGMLYRNNNANAHGRIASISFGQRTPKEQRIMSVLTYPDQIFFMTVVGIFFFSSCVLISFTLRYTGNTHKQKLLWGGLSEHDYYQRTDEMSHIFAEHSEAVQRIRAEIDQPEVYMSPTGWNSFSGIYAPGSSEEHA